jgi:hypothetical protein
MREAEGFGFLRKVKTALRDQRNNLLTSFQGRVRSVLLSESFPPTPLASLRARTAGPWFRLCECWRPSTYGDGGQHGLVALVRSQATRLAGYDSTLTVDRRTNRTAHRVRCLTPGTPPRLGRAFCWLVLYTSVIKRDVRKRPAAVGCCSQPVGPSFRALRVHFP